MNWPHAHLILNHVPLIGGMVGTVLFLLAAGKRNRDAMRAALAVLAVAALLAVPTFLSGNRAEEDVEHLPGVTEAMIEEHEEAALPALIGSCVLALLALIGLGASRRGRAVPGWLTALVILVGIGSSALLVWTTNLGGKIRHTEIRGGSEAAASGAHEDVRR